jgi:sec-independent protein translocase protein TatB
MIDLSLPELALIGVVALLVLGPERLPGAARTAGAMLRRAQRSWSGLRADIERELAADEFKRQLQDTRTELAVDQLRQNLESARDDVVRGLDPGIRPPGVAPPPPAAIGEPAAGANPAAVDRAGQGDAATGRASGVDDGRAS